MLLISVIVIAIVGVTYTPMGRAISAGSTRFDKKASEGTKRGGFGLQGNEQR